MGIHKEVRKIFGSSVLNYMIAARTAQGFEEYKDSTLAERTDIINRWREHKSEYQNSKQRLIETRRPEGQDSGRLSPRGFIQSRHLSFEERKKLHDERKAKREDDRHKVHSKDGRRSCPFCSRCHPHTHTPREVQQSPTVPDRHREVGERSTEQQNADFEDAIRASVAATSRGDADEDAMIERAIRASVKELQNAGGNADNSEALARAIQASIAEAGRRRSNEDHIITMNDEEAEHQQLLEKAIQESLSQYQMPSRSRDADADVDTDDDEAVKLAIAKSREAPTVTDVDSDEDENIRKAIEKSKETPPEADVDTDDDEDVRLALAKSKSEHMEKLTRAQTEEEIVLEYVKKQSLAEEEHKRNVLGKAKAVGDSAADEEALKQAIEESLKASGGSNKVGEASGS